jgi:hypothetical protein
MLAKIGWYVSGPHKKKNQFFISALKSPTYRDFMAYAIKIIKIEEMKNLTLGHL